MSRSGVPKEEFTRLSMRWRLSNKARQQSVSSLTHVVLTALKRAPSDLSAHQKKILHIDDHCGIAIAGLTADARILSRFMRMECLNERYAFDRPMPVTRLVGKIGAKSQIPTQRYGRRPFGVGLLVAGYDDSGSQLYQTCPSGNFYECKAMAIGARSQSARTYLERHLDSFPSCGLEELVAHALRALRETLPTESDLTNKNTSVAVVGKGCEFEVGEDGGVDRWLALIEGEARTRRAPAAADDADAPMDDAESQQDPEVPMDA